MSILHTWATRLIRERRVLRGVFSRLVRLGTDGRTAWHRAEEAVQESLSRVLDSYGQSPQRFTDEAHFVHTVRRAAFNWITDEHRRRPPAALEFDPAARRPDARVEDLREALTRLSAEDQQVLRLKHVEDEPLREIADRLGVSIATAWRRVKDAEERLRGLL